MEEITESVKARLFKYTFPEPNTGCWIWGAWCNNKGYGMLNLLGKRKLSHRLMYELHYGKIPKGMSACHKCDNPACVNPDHIFIATHKENMHDMQRKGRKGLITGMSINAGEKHPLSKLTEDDVRFIRSNKKNLSQQELANTFNVLPNCISRIINRKRWKHIK